jgi:hypothetical protein
MNAEARKCVDTAKPPVVREYDIGGTKYVVKSVFIGTQDVKSAILKLAERKAIKEMGLDRSIP